MSLRIYPVILQVIREVKRRYLPRIEAEDPDLARQLRRALCSMSLNTGEGMHAQGRNRRARYFTAKGSTSEVLSGLEAAVALEYIPRMLTYDWLPADLTNARCIVAALVSAKDESADARLVKLANTIGSRGGQVVGQLIQRRGVSRSRGPGGVGKMTAPLEASTVFGSGKVRELAQLVSATSATVIVIENPLKTAQQERLAAATGCRVVASRP